MGLLLGYVRTSTTDQHGKVQFEALMDAGVPEDQIWFDQMSGSKEAKERPAMKELLRSRVRRTKSWSIGLIVSAEA